MPLQAYSERRKGTIVRWPLFELPDRRCCSSKTIRWSKHSQRSVPMTRCTTALARGDRTGVAIASMPIRLARWRKSRQ